MRFVSLFSGIGGFDLGLERAGHTCVAQVEKDKHCQKILRRHWPHVHFCDDVHDFGKETFPLGTVDLCVGGFPCTDLSLAGQRRGLAGEASGLWSEFRRIIAELRPEWVLIENVPGLLSSNQGRDMGTILAQLADLGYGWAYRVLDSRYFGVPQRRRRVFIVGCLGGIERASSVLFESEGVRGDSQTGGEAQQEVAGASGDGAAGHRGASAFGWNVAGSSRTYITRKGDYAQIGAQSQDAVYIPELAKSLRGPRGTGREDQDTIIAVPDPAYALGDNAGNRTGSGRDGQDTFVFAQNQRAEVRDLGDSVGSLSSQPGMNQQRYIAFTERGREGGSNLEYQEDVAYALTNPGDGGRTTSRQVAGPSGVRRLMPVETLRLQGFDDDWCDGISDTQVYRMTGNAVTVPVITWIGKRFPT